MNLNGLCDPATGSELATVAVPATRVVDGRKDLIYMLAQPALAGGQNSMLGLAPGGRE
jgi:hypothetical protein